MFWFIIKKILKKNSNIFNLAKKTYIFWNYLIFICKRKIKLNKFEKLCKNILLILNYCKYFIINSGEWPPCLLKKWSKSFHLLILKMNIKYKAYKRFSFYCINTNFWETFLLLNLSFPFISHFLYCFNLILYSFIKGM